MDYVLVILVLTGALAIAAAQTRQYFFVSVELKWMEAQTFCRIHFYDLATVENAADVSAVVNTAPHKGKAWIGLHGDLVKSWRWSLNSSSFYSSGETEFRNWIVTQPNNFNGQQYCVALFIGRKTSGTWGAVNCTLQYPFICYNGSVNGTASFVKINQSFSWYDAQKFCRENHVDLASVRNQRENAALTTLAAGPDAALWIGLHREMRWSDGSPSLFGHWALGQPDSGHEECVTTALNNSGLWSDDNCSLTFPFVCYKTIPPNAENFKLVQTSETLITLQWDRVTSNVSFILQYASTMMTVPSPDGSGPISFIVRFLSPGTQYTFILFSGLDNVLSSGVNLTAATAPLNTNSFILTGQNETSISLQWNKVSNHSFILQFDSSVINIPPPDGDGAVNHTVSGLTAGTEFTFTLFTVFKSVRSTGAVLRARTSYVVGFNVRFQSLVQLSNSDIENILETFLRTNGLSSQAVSLKVTSVRNNGGK